jgi:hypothetical protein
MSLSSRRRCGGLGQTQTVIRASLLCGGTRFEGLPPMGATYPPTGEAPVAWLDGR